MWISISTDCSCGQQWCWFHPLHQDSQLCRHTIYPLGYISQKMDRAIPVGNIPVGHYLQKILKQNEVKKQQILTCSLFCY